MRLILASASPRRKELMSLVTDDFEIIPSDADETLPDDITAEKAPAYLARLKAAAVFRDNPDSAVIGCDTVVVLGNEIMGKPADDADAARMLAELSGRRHRVITGVCIMMRGENGDTEEKLFSQISEVEFYPLTPAEIDDYVRSGEPRDKAGAYGIQGLGGMLVKEIKGDYNNIVGLPAARLKRELIASAII